MGHMHAAQKERGTCELCSALQCAREYLKKQRCITSMAGHTRHQKKGSDAKAEEQRTSLTYKSLFLDRHTKKVVYGLNKGSH
jgi:hypothetical protein